MTVRVGIIGGGVIGAAHAAVFRHYCEVKVYDLVPQKATHPLLDVLHCDVIFVCVPTPMRKNGSADPKAVRDVLHAIRAESSAAAVILKSTLPPRELLELDRMFYGAAPSFIFSPEFLTERSAEYELQQSGYFIFGEQWATAHARKVVDDLFELRWPEVPRYWTSLETAAMVKYMRNTFFAVKVALMNEYTRLLRSYGAETKKALDLFMLDPRIGRSHFQVPGHDGKLGFGGVCFLKDVNALAIEARAQGAPLSIVEAAWKSNVEIRGSDRIAEELARMVGRACSEPMNQADVEKLGR